MSVMEVLLLIWIFAAGACVGSFLNVVIFRLPNGQSINWPPSHCPVCGTHIKWYENIPLISYVMLRAKCRYCGTPLSVQYPLIEGLTALLFIGLWLVYFHLPGAWPALHEAGYQNAWPIYLMHVLLVAVLIAATVIDARLFIIPLELPWFAAFMGLVLPAGAFLVFADPNLRAAMINWTPSQSPAPIVASTLGVHLTAGLAGGWLLGLALLKLGLLPQSFADEEELLSRQTAEAQAAEQAKAHQGQQEARDGSAVAGSTSSTDAPSSSAAFSETEGAADSASSAAPGEASSESEPSAAPTDGGVVHAMAPVAADASPAAATSDGPPGSPASVTMPAPSLAESPGRMDGQDDAAEPAKAKVGYTAAEIEKLFEYPHPRREMAKEILFLAFPLIGAIVAYALTRYGVTPGPGEGLAYPIWLKMVCGAALGYFIGGGVIWFMRIAGTLAFGREAMGLGDVHLLAGIGAILGGAVACLVPFLAAFIGVGYAVVMVGLGRIMQKRFSPIPFGPHLAVATLVLMMVHEPIMRYVRPYVDDLSRLVFGNLL